MNLHSHHSRHIVQNFVQTEIHRLHLQLTCLDLGKIQDVIDDPQKRVCRALYFRQIVRLLGSQLSLQRQVGHSNHRIHGSPDLVTHVGQKIRFRFGGFLSNLLCTPHLLFCKLPRRYIAESDHRPDETAVLMDRVAGISYRKNGTIFSPQHFTVDMAGGST